MLLLFWNLCELFVILGVPFLALVWPRWPRRPVGLFPRFLLTVLLVWGLAILVRMASEEARIGAAIANGANPDDDGIGGNLVYLLFGWLIGLFGALPSLLIALAKGFMARRRDRRSGMVPASADS